MATALSRNGLRGTYRSLYSYAFYQLRSTKPSFTLLHGVSEALHHRPPPLSQAEIRRVRGLQSFAMYDRCLCSGTATSTATGATSTATANQSNSSSGSSDRKGESSDRSREGAEQGKPVRGGPVSWMSFLLLVATGAGLIFYYDKEKRRHIEEINSASDQVKQGPSVGKAAIGGPFSLVDHNGRAVTEKDFFGKWTVVYFGFTNCPDICPVELQKLVEAVDKIKKKSGIEIVPVFISVDPERDTVEQVREYVQEFHPSLIGLTGTPDEIKKTARAFRVYYMKTEEEGSDYLVDHSIVMYLMDPRMEYVKFFGKNNDVDSLSDGIIKEIKQYKNIKK
ncbi:hypothetical protein NMG60_11000169 [Bertholletia excelsa]